MKDETFDDQMMQLSFGSYSPCIAGFPHCIFPASELAVTIVSRAVGARAGVWGNASLLFNRQGEPYLDDEDDACMVEDFHLWEIPENQEEVLRYGKGRSGAGFVMGIDAQTPLDILHEMSQRLPVLREADRFEYLHCLDLLCDWIKKLGWSYVLLDNEHGHAMFVTSHKYAGLVAKVTQELQRAGKEVFYLQDDGKRFHWEAFEAQDREPS